MSPAAYWLARRVSRAVSATDSLIRAIRCGRDWPTWTGTGASPTGISRSASLIAVSATAALSRAGTAVAGGSPMRPQTALRMAMPRNSGLLTWSEI
jgi:hypothetical protein